MSETEALPVERRCAARIPVRFPVTLERLETMMVDAEAKDLSLSGMLVRAEVDLPIWASFRAVLPCVDAREVRIVRRDGGDYGCLFQTPLTDEELETVIASEPARAGVERLRAETDAPPVRRNVLRFWGR